MEMGIPNVDKEADDYLTRVHHDPRDIPAQAWNELLAAQDAPTPFMRHEMLCALHESGCARTDTGWTAAFITLWRGSRLEAGCPVYLKTHSYGEYVFDWAWADAYQRHGLAYYPKALVAVPFTPVPGSRLLARDAPTRRRLVQGLVDWCRQTQLSSLHLLFVSEQDQEACQGAGLMARHTVQFHWHNAGYADFEGFLGSLSQDKRKKIRQERRKVLEAGVQFRVAQGPHIETADWDFFYQCYERTYLEHGNAPYLSRAFFSAMAESMPEHWVMFIAERGGRPVAASLVGLGADASGRVAYGRYWGALERVDCLHFEACYYQPLAWCIAQGVGRFEGGAQGEHKMARALMPVRTSSAHWLARPDFSEAVERFLAREGQGVERYLEHLGDRSPFRQSGPMDGA